MAQRLSEHERAASFLAAQRGEIEIERGIRGAQLRAALIKAGCIVPAGWAKHEIFELDERGRREAAESIVFDETTDVTKEALAANGTDPVVAEFVQVLWKLPESTLADTRDRRQARARAWRELFPFTHDNGGAW